MKIALISFNHSESTLTLAKHLAENADAVDYYFITNLRSTVAPALEFCKAKQTIGIVRLTPYNAPTLFKYLGKTKLKAKLIRLATFNSILSLLNRLIIFWVCRKIIANNYDIINFTGQSKILVHFYKNLKNVKFVHTLHEVAKHYSQQALNNSLLNYISTNKIPVIVHSKFSYNSLIATQGFENLPIKIVPFGLFEPYKYYDDKKCSLVEDKKNILLFYGFIRPYKGLDILAEAIKIVDKKSTNYTLVIAGEGYVPELDQLAKNKNVFIINRKITDDELVDLNRRCKFIVCPYKSASQSGIVMTSFLFDKPVIATNVGAFKDNITDGVNGIIVEPNSPMELAESIIKLLEDQELYNALVSNLRNLQALESYDWQNIAESTIDFYKKATVR